MGTTFDIYRLYRWPTKSVGFHLLVKAERRGFSGSDQTAEDSAIRDVERRIAAIVARETSMLSTCLPDPVASWEGAYPEGDLFYDSHSGIELFIWFALDTVHPGYFVFGTEPDEAAFWQSIEQLSRDGDICDIGVYSRPAERIRVRFVQ